MAKKGRLVEFPLLFDGTEVAFFLKKRAKKICLKTLNMYRFVKTPWYRLTLICSRVLRVITCLLNDCRVINITNYKADDHFVIVVSLSLDYKASSTSGQDGVS